MYSLIFVVCSTVGSSCATTADAEVYSSLVKCKTQAALVLELVPDIATIHQCVSWGAES